jgi:hypothetical protein
VTQVRSWPPGAGVKRRRHRPLLRWTALIVAAVVIFGLGLALGQTFDDNVDPATSPSQTIVRTLGPLPLSAPSTVTVTVTRP